MKVRVLRPFYLSGTVVERGAVVEVADRPLVGCLLSHGKAEVVSDDAPTAGPMTTETAGGLARGRGRPRKADETPKESQP